MDRMMHNPPGGSRRPAVVRRARSGEDPLRRAEARRRLEEYREQQLLERQISDIFSDEGLS
ncbi:MAG: hypothetical protein P8076_04055 [Gammaproteobacteria bacterium]